MQAYEAFALSSIANFLANIDSGRNSPEHFITTEYAQLSYFLVRKNRLDQLVRFIRKALEIRML